MIDYRPNTEFRPLAPFLSLLKREVWRFFSVAVQTIVTPVVTASLYLFVFGLHLGAQLSVLEGFTYIQFVVPGLILMGVVTNSFANTSSSLFFYRYLNGIVELLVIPITPFRFALAFTLAAVLRGLIVGAVVWGISMFFTDLPWANPAAAVAMLVLSSYLFAQFGLVAAIHSGSFDSLAMYTNFLILPLIYLGGMFYPISQLPEGWQAASRWNPVYYMMDGFRQAILGLGENPLGFDLGVAAGLSALLGAYASYLIWKSKRLRV